MESVEAQIVAALRPLTGLRLSLWKSTGSMIGFHFGEVLYVDQARMGEYALHVNCPWRIEAADGILTGSGDYFSRADGLEGPRDWDTIVGSYEEQALMQFVGDVGVTTEASANTGDRLIVEEVIADRFGGLTVSFSGGDRLVLFPSGSRPEQWRLIGPGDGDHYVLEGGSLSILPAD